MNIFKENRLCNKLESWWWYEASESISWLEKQERELIDWINNLTPEQVQNIVDMMTNSWEYETYLSKATKYWSNRDDLDNLQKLLISPWEWIELFVVWIISTFSTLSEWWGIDNLYSWAVNLYNNPKIMEKLWKVWYNKLNDEQRVAAWIKLWFSLTVAPFAFTKLLRYLSTVIRTRKALLLKAWWTATWAYMASAASTASGMDDASDLWELSIAASGKEEVK